MVKADDLIREQKKRNKLKEKIYKKIYKRIEKKLNYVVILIHMNVGMKYLNLF